MGKDSAPRGDYRVGDPQPFTLNAAAPYAAQSAPTLSCIEARYTSLTTEPRPTVSRTSR